MRTVETETRVRFSEVDSMGIVHNSYYFVYTDLGRNELWRQVLGFVRKPGDENILTPLVEANFTYKSPARFDDVLIIRTTPAFLKTSSYGFDYEVVHKQTGALVCTCRVVHVCLSKETMRPVEAPASIKKLFAE